MSASGWRPAVSPSKSLAASFALLLSGLSLAGDPPHYHAREVHGSPGAVSADILRHPIGEKVRRMLRLAMDRRNRGDHEAAIKHLLEILSQHPESAAYVHSLLGVEYMKTGRFQNAVDSLEHAVALLPHDAINRHNLAVSLLCNRDVARGEREARRALQLDPGNAAIRELVDALDRWMEGSSKGAGPE